MSDPPPGPVPPPPPPPAPPPSGAGCVRLVLFALLLIVAASAAAAVAFAIFASNSADRPQFAARSPVIGSPPSIGPPPLFVPLGFALRRRVADSVVRVSGTACQEIQQGTGFVVRPGYVVTNAHVVAGEATTMVTDHDRQQFVATVVHFDPVRDLALLHIAGADAAAIPPLALADPRAPSELAVFGHPGGGALRIAPARLSPSGFVDAVGRDIYGHTAPGARKLLALGARLAPGDSGGPVVDVDGRVVAMAFAIDPSGAPIAYALTPAEVETAISAAVDAVPTGHCISL